MFKTYRRITIEVARDYAPRVATILDDIDSIDNEIFINEDTAYLTARISQSYDSFMKLLHLKCFNKSVRLFGDLILIRPFAIVE